MIEGRGGHPARPSRTMNVVDRYRWIPSKSVLGAGSEPAVCIAGGSPGRIWGRGARAPSARRELCSRHVRARFSGLLRGSMALPSCGHELRWVRECRRPPGLPRRPSRTSRGRTRGGRLDLLRGGGGELGTAWMTAGHDAPPQDRTRRARRPSGVSFMIQTDEHDANTFYTQTRTKSMRRSRNRATECGRVCLE
jgi:hypothetical protein